MADVTPGGSPDPGTPVPHTPVPHGQGSMPSGDAQAHGWPSGTPLPSHDPALLVHDAAAPTPDPPVGPSYSRTGWRRWLPIAGVISGLLLAAIGMLLFLGVNMGPAALAIGLTAAVLPVPLLVASFLWLDRYEPEPIRYLAFCFVWGAAVATAVALAVNTGAAYLFDKAGLPDALVAVLVAPFIEETMKAVGPILLLWRRRVEWSGITDGIVYCGLSALGFAMVENVLYLGGHGYAAGAEEFGPASGLMNLFAIFIVRIIFTGFAHPLFTAMTGIGLGIAARSGDRRVRWLAPIAGLLFAMILHGTFNLLPTLTVSLGQPLIMLYGYLGIMVPLFFAVVGLAIALRAWEGRLTERVLPHYVRTGWFAPPEVASLGSLGRRHAARQWAKRVAGGPGQKAMKSFQFAATQLALLRDGMQRGLDRRPQDQHRATVEEQRLLTEIEQYRAAFAGRDPQAPQAFWNGQDYQIAFPDGVVRTVAAPSEPVVPVPVRLAPQPAFSYGYGSGAPHYGSPYAPPAFSGPPGWVPGGGYSTPGGPGYSTSGGPGYSAPGGPGYSAPGGSGYSAPGGSGYSAPGGSGYSTSGGPGYSAPVGPGYSTPGGPGYSTSGGPDYSAPGGSGYSAPGGSGYSAPGGPGYSAPGGPGYSAWSGQPGVPVYPSPTQGGYPQGPGGYSTGMVAPGYPVPPTFPPVPTPSPPGTPPAQTPPVASPAQAPPGAPPAQTPPGTPPAETPPVAPPAQTPPGTPPAQTPPGTPPAQTLPAATPSSAPPVSAPGQSSPDVGAWRTEEGDPHAGGHGAR